MRHSSHQDTVVTRAVLANTRFAIAENTVQLSSMPAHVVGYIKYYSLAHQEYRCPVPGCRRFGVRFFFRQTLEVQATQGIPFTTTTRLTTARFFLCWVTLEEPRTALYAWYRWCGGCLTPFEFRATHVCSKPLYWNWDDDTKLKISVCCRSIAHEYCSYCTVCKCYICIQCEIKHGQGQCGWDVLGCKWAY